jgi:hypothetical protein
MSDDKVDAYFNKQEGAVSDIALSLRDLLEEVGEGLSCKLAWGFPCWSGNERIVSIIALKDRCNLQLFSGSRLAEMWPSRIDGTGKQLRHVKVYAISDIDDELRKIVLAAIELDKTDPQKVR